MDLCRKEGFLKVDEKKISKDLEARKLKEIEGFDYYSVMQAKEVSIDRISEDRLVNKLKRLSFLLSQISSGRQKKMKKMKKNSGLYCNCK